MVVTRGHLLSAVAYVGSILLGNIFVLLFGLGSLVLFNTNQPDQVYFSLTFPLGALWIGITFSLRDFVQRIWGHWYCWIWMLSATVLTYFFNVNLALASIVSFLASEFVDWSIFLILCHRPLRTRLIVSNLFSCPVDSFLFVTIAFGVPWYSDAVWGQAVVKYGFGLLALPLIPVVENFFKKSCRTSCQDAGMGI